LREITLAKILEALLVLVAVYILVRLSGALLERLASRVPRSRFFFKMMARVIAPSQQTLWAVFTAVGVALGLGAQDLVKERARRPGHPD
jgi:hypothetical protein